MLIRFLRLQGGDPLPEIRDFSPCKAVVIIDEPAEPQWQANASRWLVASGCRYRMAWGADCSSWDDSVDLANLEQFGFGDIPDDEFAMTTWHDDEPLEDIWFAKVSAHHPTLAIENILLLLIGSVDREQEVKALFEAV